MLLVVTSLADPDLPCLLSRLGVAVVVPGHLSQNGWLLDDRDNMRTRLVTSRGPVLAEELSGVVVRLARVTSKDLAHVDARDRDYVAAEMTAFLAAMCTALPCPVLNRPTATSLLGVAWNQQHWWRVAAREGLAVCTANWAECAEGTGIVLLDGQPLLEPNIPERHVEAAQRLTRLAGVRLALVEFCEFHGKVRRVSLVPRLTVPLLDAIEDYVVTAGNKL